MKKIKGVTKKLRNYARNGEHVDYHTNVTGTITPEIAEKYGTKAIDVERAIRHGITVAWERKKEESFNAVFGNCICAKKPTNGDFIALAADRLLYGTFSKY